LPSRVVTTTLETRVLFLNVRVSVVTPLSVEGVISELSGAGRVSVVVLDVVVVATVVVFAFVFEVVPESEQPAARLASATTPSPTINLIRTALPSLNYSEH
jgi:hypothetical protein